MTDVAQVDKATGVVLNVIVVDKALSEEEQFVFDPAFDWVEVTEGTGPALINGTWNSSVFTPPPKPEGFE